MQRSQIKRGDKLKFLFAVRIISHLFQEGLKALKKISFAAKAEAKTST